MAFLEMRPYIWIPSAPKIYGAEWLGTSDPAWTRTDDAAGLSDPNPAVNNGNGNSPFDTIYPWKDVRRVEDSAAGTLVEIPKFYYKRIRSGTKMKLLITDTAADGFYISPAHADRGDGVGERDVAYVGAYHCASDYKSKTGVLPLGNKTRAEFRTGIHSLGSTIWQNDFAMFWTVGMLYLVEFANWNSQAKIGYGCGNGSSTENTGLCDAMIYHTGTNAASRTTYGHVRYRYIEDLWANVMDFCDGFYRIQNNVYCIKNPANFGISDGTLVVTDAVQSSGCSSAFSNPIASGFEYALFQSSVVNDTSYSTYICDRCNSDTAPLAKVLYVGGNISQNQGRGMFYMSSDNMEDAASSNIGSRLMKLP